MSRSGEILKSILSVIPTLLLAITLAFLVIQLTPGDPAEFLLGDYATPEEVENLRQVLGLDKPIYIQYWTYVTGVLRGDFGSSLRTDRPVLSEIFRVFPYTLQLALTAVGLSAVIGLPLGMISALRRNSLYDHIARFLALLWVSMPSFWFALILLLFLSLYAGWFPMVGMGDVESPMSLLHHLFLPAVALGARHAALVTRITRSSVLEVIRQDYILTARAKGLPEWVVNYKHALRNALIPVVTVVALDIGATLGGTVVIETVFSRPGLGTLIIGSIRARDYPQLQGSILFVAFCFIVVNLLTDIVYKFIDPRIEYVKEGE